MNKSSTGVITSSLVAALAVGSLLNVSFAQGSLPNNKVQQAQSAAGQSATITIKVVLDGKTQRLSYPRGAQLVCNATKAISNSKDKQSGGLTLIGNVRISAKEGNKEILLAKGDKATLEYGAAPVAPKSKAVK